MKPMHARRAAPMVLGILGGLAGGKSTVAGLLARRGAAVIDADRIGHQVLERPEVRDALRSAFGEQILDKASRIERRLLAQAAFGSPHGGPHGVDVLNGIVHPPILEEIRLRVEEIKRLKEVPLIVLDAALLVETGLDKELCEKLLYVDAPEDVRRRRARDERGIEPEQFEQRARAQASPEEKRKLADYVVTNNGSLEELDEQVGRLWTTLVGNSRQHGR